MGEPQGLAVTARLSSLFLLTMLKAHLLLKILRSWRGRENPRFWSFRENSSPKIEALHFGVVMPSPLATLLSEGGQAVILGAGPRRRASPPLVAWSPKPERERGVASLEPEAVCLAGERRALHSAWGPDAGAPSPLQGFQNFGPSWCGLGGRRLLGTREGSEVGQPRAHGRACAVTEPRQTPTTAAGGWLCSPFVLPTPVQVPAHVRPPLGWLDPRPVPGRRAVRTCGPAGTWAPRPLHVSTVRGT